MAARPPSRYIWNKDGRPITCKACPYLDDLAGKQFSVNPPQECELYLCYLMASLGVSLCASLSISNLSITKNENTLLVLKFASYLFSLSFKFARFNFAHLVKTYLRSFKFPQVIFRVRSFWFVQ